MIRMMRKKRVVLEFIFLVHLLSGSFVSAAEPDWDEYDSILQQYTHNKTENGLSYVAVDYRALLKQPKFNALIEQITNFPLKKLHTREEKLAFYINAYNIFAIKIVLHHWPVTSIKDIGGWFNPVWDKPVAKLDGRMHSLNDIEHKILRPMNEARIHMAIVCASKSCPDLRQEAYRAHLLDQQLTQQSHRFLNNTSKGLKIQTNKIQLSKIFSWFAEDFADNGGVIAFVQRHHNKLNKKHIIDDYFDYNWDLNQ